MRETIEGRDDTIVRYHERTKHLVGRYARSLGYLDWDTQPDPFRTYHGAPHLPLDAPAPASSDPPFDSIVLEGGTPPRPLDRASISRLMFDALAISAWKRFEESRWSLRCNPSSGNLHPTESYLVLPAVLGFTEHAGVHHYDVKGHALELRRPWPAERFSRAFPALGPGGFLLGLTSIHWREAWKYGERAFRYCQHDVGHAIGAIAYAASALGWRTRVLDHLADATIAALLAIDDQSDIEGEVPDLLLLIEPADAPPRGSPFEVDDRIVEEMATRPRLGARNTLSADHVAWDAIDAAAAATVKPLTSAREERAAAGDASAGSGANASPRPVGARAIFRGRRSAVAFDGVTGITRDAFLRVCERSMPRPSRVPFGSFAHEPAIHPVFFVHRVAGLSPGLYVLPRSERAVPLLRAAMRDTFRWEPVEGGGDGLPLRMLETGDVRNGASFVSCQQAIASDGAFAVAMLAEFEPRIRESGPWFYRTLHHEAGALGQTLYLEAEALGIRGTGIGCFFDDEVHRLLGLRDRTFQTIYHFTIGAPVEDPRIVSEPGSPDPSPTS